MRLSDEQAKALGIGHLIPREGAIVRRAAHTMNGTERRYADFLESLRLAHRIRAWDFQPERLRLAGRCFYEPDFRVTLWNGLVEMHETKGHMRDDAAVKLKVAARLHPCYVFRVAFDRGKNKPFDIRHVGPGGIATVGGWEP